MRRSHLCGSCSRSPAWSVLAPSPIRTTQPLKRKLDCCVMRPCGLHGLLGMTMRRAALQVVSAPRRGGLPDTSKAPPALAPMSPADGEQALETEQAPLLGPSPPLPAARSPYDGPLNQAPQEEAPEAVSSAASGSRMGGAGAQNGSLATSSSTSQVAPASDSSVAPPVWWHNQGRALAFMGQSAGAVALAAGLGLWARWVAVTLTKGPKALMGEEAAVAGSKGKLSSVSLTGAAAAAKARVSGTSLPKPPTVGPDTFGDPFAPLQALLGVKAASKQREERATGKVTNTPAGKGTPGPARPPGPTRPPGPARPPVHQNPNWWRSLSRIHYINFGAQYGILPRITLDLPVGSLPSLLPGGASKAGPACLVVFEDAGDAEFVAATLRMNLERALELQGRGEGDREGDVASLSPQQQQRALKYSVLPGSPLFLDDLAQLQGAKLGVIPQGVLSRSKLLSDGALQVLLSGILSGKMPDQAPKAEDERQGRDAADSMPPAAAGLAGGRIRAPGPEDFPGTEFGSESNGSGGAGSEEKGAAGPQPTRPVPRQAGGFRTSPNVASGAGNFKFEFSGFKSPPESSIRKPADVRSGSSLVSPQLDSATASPQLDSGTALPQLDSATALPQPYSSTALPQLDSTATPSQLVSATASPHIDSDTTSHKLDSAPAPPQPDSAAALPQLDSATASPQPDRDSVSPQPGSAADTLPHTLDVASSDPYMDPESIQLRVEGAGSRDDAHLGVDQALSEQPSGPLPGYAQVAGSDAAVARAGGAAPSAAVPPAAAGERIGVSESAAPAGSVDSEELRLLAADNEHRELLRLMDEKDDEARRLQAEEQVKRRKQAEEQEKRRKQAPSADQPASGSGSMEEQMKKEMERVVPSDDVFKDLMKDSWLGLGEGPWPPPSPAPGGPDATTSSQQPREAADREELLEEEKQDLLSEWYSLVKRPQAAAHAVKEERKVRKPSGSSSNAAASNGQAGGAATAADQAEQQRSSPVGANPSRKAARPASSTRPSSGTSSVTAEVMPGDPLRQQQQMQEGPGGNSREEEDAYVAAVLRNLELVDAKVKAADAKMARATALARGGDAAAAAARSAAEAQLSPLRDQLAQLQQLHASLKELNDGGEEAAKAAADAAAAGDSQGIFGGGSAGGSHGRAGSGVVQAAEFVEEGRSGREASQAQSSGMPSMPQPSRLPRPSVVSGVSTGSGASSARSWGSWTSNQRIKDADVSLIKREQLQREVQPASKSSGSREQLRRSSAAGSSGERQGQASSRGSMDQWEGRDAAGVEPGPSRRQAPDAPSTSAAPPDDPETAPAWRAGTAPSSRWASSDNSEDDKVVIVNKRAGLNKAPKIERSAEEKQATVKEALRFATSELSGTNTDMGPSVAAGGRGSDRTWWSSKFQALWLPNLRYADESMGFVQLDVSLNESTKDMRVLAFEDRHDATHCMAVLKQWPEYDWCDMSVSLLPTKTIEADIESAFYAQAENNDGVSAPSGIVVFRRGKLPMRVGMSLEEFTQVVVYQAAAQVSLSRVGYGFDDF